MFYTTVQNQQLNKRNLYLFSNESYTNCHFLNQGFLAVAKVKKENNFWQTSFGLFDINKTWLPNGTLWLRVAPPPAARRLFLILFFSHLLFAFDCAYFATKKFSPALIILNLRNLSEMPLHRSAVTKSPTNLKKRSVSASTMIDSLFVCVIWHCTRLILI